VGKMLNENHVFNQMNKDEKVETKRTFAESINELYKLRINTLNNEEKAYENVEDPRVLDEKKSIYASEIGYNLNSNPLLHIGHCKRALYLRLTGAIGKDREVGELESIARNMFVKTQWLEKIEFAQLNCESDSENDSFARDIRGLNIMTTNECFVKDYSNNRIFALLIKPVNDTAFSIRDRLWSDKYKPQPLNEHLAEVATLLIYYKKPVKILYVGKNNPEMVREFNFGVSNGNLTVNGELVEGFRMADLFTQIDDIKLAFTSNMIPPRDYIRPRLLNITEIGELIKNGIINKREGEELANGKEYENFHCSSCKYREICNSIDDNWFKLVN
jgi:hypothetical protein